MKPATEALAKRLSGEAILNQFLLVGGTALSVYLEHRLSEDLDFATAEQTLPKKEIAYLLDRLSKEGASIADAVPMIDRQYAINEGYDLEDYQQDWLVDGVKLTFFALPKDNGREKLAEDPGTPWQGNLRLASLETLFVTKALVLADRHAIRDNFDMKTFFEKPDFSYQDLITAFQKYRPGTSLEIPKKRLLNSDYPLADPGLMGLVEQDEAVIIGEIKKYFTELLAEK